MGSKKAVNGEGGFVFGEPLDRKIIERKSPIVRRRGSSGLLIVVLGGEGGEISGGCEGRGR